MSGGTPGYRYSWSFGDGASATTASPQHTFGPGPYQVILTVTDAANKANQYGLQVTATSNLSGSASGGPSPVDINYSVQFYGSGSGGSTNYNYLWDFGDKTATVTAQNPAHKFAASGTYKVTLTVSDANYSASAQPSVVTITVEPRLQSNPQVNANPANCNSTFTGSASGGLGASYYAGWHWIFGDGSADYYGQNPGLHVWPASGGSYYVTLYVTDGESSATTGFWMTVSACTP